jgi:hypothetical protein
VWCGDTAILCRAHPVLPPAIELGERTGAGHALHVVFGAEAGEGDRGPVADPGTGDVELDPVDRLPVVVTRVVPLLVAGGGVVSKSSTSPSLS